LGLIGDFLGLFIIFEQVGGDDEEDECLSGGIN
jgi:hypothetical protein